MHEPASVRTAPAMQLRVAMPQYRLRYSKSVIVARWRSTRVLSGFKHRTGILSRQTGPLRWRRRLPIRALATRQAVPVRDALRQTLSADLAVVSTEWREFEPEPAVGNAPGGSVLSRTGVEFEAEERPKSSARREALSPALHCRPYMSVEALWLCTAYGT